MSCEYLAGLGEKSMAIVESLCVQKCHFCQLLAFCQGALGRFELPKQ